MLTYRAKTCKVISKQFETTIKIRIMYMMKLPNRVCAINGYSPLKNTNAKNY